MLRGGIGGNLLGQRRTRTQPEVILDETQPRVSEATVHVRSKAARYPCIDAATFEVLVGPMLAIGDQPWQVLGSERDVELALVEIQPDTVH